MKIYKNYINKCLKKKYKGITFFEKKFFISFFYFRNESKALILKLKNKKNIIVPKDETYKQLLDLNNGNISFSTENKIVKFFKKFEINLILRKKYSKDLKKLSSEETSLHSYVILGILINKSKKIGTLQKINSILKILDKILVNKKNLYKCNFNDLLKLLLIERKILVKILNI